MIKCSSLIAPSLQIWLQAHISHRKHATNTHLHHPQSHCLPLASLACCSASASVVGVDWGNTVEAAADNTAAVVGGVRVVAVGGKGVFEAVVVVVAVIAVVVVVVVVNAVVECEREQS